MTKNARVSSQQHEVAALIVWSLGTDDRECGLGQAVLARRDTMLFVPSYVAFHLVELFANALEPSYLPAGHTALAGSMQVRDVLAICRDELGTLDEAFVDEIEGTQALVVLGDRASR